MAMPEGVTNLFRDIAVDTFFEIGLREKILDDLVSTMAARDVITLLRVSSSNSGTHRSCFGVFVGKSCVFRIYLYFFKSFRNWRRILEKRVVRSRAPAETTIILRLSNK
jgi:hypothetical protein